MGDGGNGLWCYAPEKKEKERKENPMQKIERKTENSMLDFLEKKCSELTIEVEQEKAKCKLSNLEVIQLKNGIEGLNKVTKLNGFHVINNPSHFFQKISEMVTDLNNERRLRSNADNNLDNLKELYNKSNREISRLNSELNSEKSNNAKTQENLNELKNTLGIENSNMREHLKKKTEKIEELEEINEDLQSRLAENKYSGKKIEDESKQNI